MNVLRMKLPIVEKVPTPWESILKLFLTLKLPHGTKIPKNIKIEFADCPVFSISASVAAIPY